MSSTSSASSTAPHVSPVLGHRSWRQRNDGEIDFEVYRNEMKKIQEARKRMMDVGGAAASDARADAFGAGGGGGGGGTETKRSSHSYSHSHSHSRMNACDINGEEFQIVCEELWVDFKSWMNHHDNLNNCVSKTRAVVASNWMKIVSVLVFLIWFRWYIGTGKEACSYGVGYGVFSFVCEVLRHMGEFVAALVLMVSGFCVGLLPLIVCVCFYEFKDAFPDPAEDEAEDEAEDGHLKKE